MQHVIPGRHSLKQCQVLKQLALTLHPYSAERIQKEVEVCSAKSFFRQLKMSFSLISLFSPFFHISEKDIKENRLILK